MNYGSKFHLNLKPKSFLLYQKLEVERYFYEVWPNPDNIECEYKGYKKSILRDYIKNDLFVQKNLRNKSLGNVFNNVFKECNKYIIYTDTLARTPILCQSVRETQVYTWP